jgi:signal transduction histidine kinase
MPRAPSLFWILVGSGGALALAGAFALAGIAQGPLVGSDYWDSLLVAFGLTAAGAGLAVFLKRRLSWFLGLVAIIAGVLGIVARVIDLGTAAPQVGTHGLGLTAAMISLLGGLLVSLTASRQFSSSGQPIALLAVVLASWAVTDIIGKLTGADELYQLAIFGRVGPVIAWATLLFAFGIMVRSLAGREGPIPWGPLGATLLLCLGTLTLYNGMKLQERAQILESTRNPARLYASEVASRMSNLLGPLDRMARRREFSGLVDRETWSFQARLNLLHYPAFMGMAWIAHDGSSTWPEPPGDNSLGLDTLPDSEFAAARSAPANSLHLTPPLRLPDGTAGFRIWSAVRQPDGEPMGFIVGTVAYESLFEDILDRLERDREATAGYSLSILDEGEPIHRRHGPGLEQWQATEEAVIGNRRWVFKVEPTPEEAYLLQSGLPYAMLIAGFLAAYLVGLVMHLRLSTQRQADLLASSNEQLRQEIEARQRAAGELDRKNRDLEMMLHVMSHDLREPLRSILSFSRMVHDSAEKLEPMERDFLSRVVRAAGRMERLLDEIYLLSKVERITAPTADIPGEKLVEESLGSLEEAIARVGGKIHLVRPFPDLPADPVWARQALVNLIANALKFSAPGQAPEIELAGYERVAQGRREAGLVVRDRGTGVPPDLQDRIFDLFQRGVGREVEGTGAGLAIVRRIAERHGGRAWMEPRAGGGSQFFVTFSNAPSLPHG